MARKGSNRNQNGRKPCAFCQTMRWVLVFTVIVVMLLAYGNKLWWLAGIQFSTLFGYLVLLFFFLVLGYRVWDEYGRPKKSLLEQEEKRIKRERQEKLFDEIDALEAQSAQAEVTQVSQTEVTQVSQTEPIQKGAKPNQQLEQGDSNEASELEENQQPEKVTLSVVSEQLDLLGFSTKQK